MNQNVKKNFAVMTAGTSFFSPNNYFSQYKEKTPTQSEWQKIIQEQKEENADFFKVPVSAEITVLRSCQRQGMFYGEPLEVHLIHSDTPDGIAAVHGVGAYIEALYSGCMVEYHKISGLNMTTSKAMLQGLHELVRELNDLFEHFKEAKDQVFFSPIGGYKTITMLGHLVAELNGYEAWYQFENADFLTPVPRLPVKIDSDNYKTGRVKEVIQQFYCLSDYSFEGVLELADLPSDLKQAIHDFPEVFHVMEDMVTFSPLLSGVLKKQASVYFPHVYTINEKDQRNKTELSIIVRQFLSDWHRFKTTTDPSQYFDIMHHEVDWGIKERDTTFSLYRKKTSPEYRAVYFLSQDRCSIYFKEIWTDKSKYGKLDQKKLFNVLNEDFKSDDYVPVPNRLFEDLESSY